jgi:uncharacterized membrane protein YkoI
MRIPTILLASLLAGAATTPVLAQNPPAHRAAEQPRISMETARRTALARVPNSTVKSEELERENGRLVYSFDLEVKGQSGMEEVWVDAMDGHVVKVEHESAKHERAEKRAEANAHRATGERAMPGLKEEKPGMAARAKIPLETARATALREVPNGRITKQEIEEENGRLVYDFDIVAPNRSGKTEVMIDAMTGAVVETKHEAAKSEKKSEMRKNETHRPSQKKPATQTPPRQH